MKEILNSLLEQKDFKAQVKFLTKKYNANEKIIQQGKFHECVYLIKKGKVRIMVSPEMKNNELAVHPGIAELGPGEIFGEFGLFDDLPASADVIVVSESEVIEIDISSFRSFLQNNPDLGYHIVVNMLQTLIHRLRHANKAIINLYSWGIKAHEIDLLLK